MRRMHVALVVLAWTSSMAWGQPADRFFSETKHDFGTVPRGAQLLHRFTWTNVEKTRREITEVRISCGCASATPIPRVVEPGQSGIIEVLVDAKKFVGQKNLTLHTTVGPDKAHLVTLYVNVHCRPDVVYNPGQIHFGPVAEGATPTQVLEIDYAGAVDWRITELNNSSPHVDAAIEEAYRKPGEVGYRVKVTLKPEAPSGDFKHVLSLRTNDPNNPVLPVLVEAVVRPSILLTPNPLFLGTLKAKQSVTKRVTLRSDKPFKIVHVEGQEQGLSVAVPSAKAVVHVLQVTWTPSEKTELNSLLVIQTDLDHHGTVRLNVQGEAQ